MEKFIVKKVLDNYQTDRNGFMRPVILMNELQGMADNHAEHLGAGRRYCIRNNCAWVVTHYLIDIAELPCEGEELKLITWPSGNSGVKAFRDFEFRGADDRLMISATSQWVLIDLEKRTPLRFLDHLQKFDYLNARALNRHFEKFAEFDADKWVSFKCRYDDIDVNQHINNAAYIVWATESVGFEFRNNHKLKALEINFKKEVNPNTDQITVDVLITGNTSQHKIRSGDIINAYIVCCWEKINK
jgi:acyl-ACP thioesterase